MTTPFSIDFRKDEFGFHVVNNETGVGINFVDAETLNDALRRATEVNEETLLLNVLVQIILKYPQLDTPLRNQVFEYKPISVSTIWPGSNDIEQVLI